MRYNNYFHNKGLWLVLTISLIFGLMGCKSASDKTKIQPVFFPPPPDKPRLQFLKSISRRDDLGPRKSSFGLEDFILGAPEVNEDINSPYGVALFENKIYVCDVGIRKVEVLDLQEHTFSYLTEDKRLQNPVNIYIDRDGAKYVADISAVFVFDRNNDLARILGQDLGIRPMDVVVRGDKLYVTDIQNQQVVVMNKITGELITKFGKWSKQEQSGPGEFALISDLDLDDQGNIYVTDRITGTITKFDPAGQFLKSYAGLGSSPGSLARAKGIALDRENRIWAVDTAPEVVKIFNHDGRLLMIFGLPGNAPGRMNMPATIVIDYDHVAQFEQYAVPGAKLEFLVLVTNQYGLNKINVYGLGSFPEIEIPAKPQLPTDVKPPVSAIPEIELPADETPSSESKEKPAVE